MRTHVLLGTLSYCTVNIHFICVFQQQFSFCFFRSYVICIHYIFFVIIFCLWHLFYCAGTTVEREIRSGIETTTTHATITLPPNVEVSKRH